MNQLLPSRILALSPLLSLVLLFTPEARSQSDAAAATLEELRAPDKMKWEVVVEREEKRDKPKRSADGAPTPPRPPELTAWSGEKDGDIYRGQRAYDDGTTEEFWMLPRMQFYRAPGETEVIRLLPGDTKAADFSESDFPELYWALGQALRAEEIDEVKFLVVEIEGSAMPLTKRELADQEQTMALLLSVGEKPDDLIQPARPTGRYRLLLDPRTRLPVRFESPDAVHTYRFSPSPGLRGVIPEAFRGAIQSWVQEFNTAARAPSAPRVRRSRSTP